MLQRKEVCKISNSEILTPWQKRRVKEIQTRLSWLIAEGKLNQENLKGKIIDLGTGSGAGLVALRNLGATQAVGVENGSGLRKALKKIAEVPRSPLEAFYPSEALQRQEKIFLGISTEKFLEVVKAGNWKINLVTCFWISYDLPVEQIEEVLTLGGQVVATAVKDGYFRLRKALRETNLEAQIIEMSEDLAEQLVKDRFIFVGTKKDKGGGF